MESAGNTIRVKKYKLCELARIYEVDVKTLRKRIQAIPEIGKRFGHYYDIRQVLIIFKELLLPHDFKIDY